MYILFSGGLDADADIPRVGITALDYRDVTWELLEEYDVDVSVVVLDEVDKLDDDELLRSLTRPRERQIGRPNRCDLRE